MFEPERIENLIELFRETDDAHREAFAETGGSNPDWPRWFAAHMQESLNEILGTDLGRDGIATLLEEAEEEHLVTSPGREWPSYYAEFFIARAM